MRSWLMAPLVAVLALTVGFGVGVRPDDARAQAGSVNIQDFQFVPASITVSVGTTVTWTNSDTAPHTATSNPGVSPAFDTGTINPGGSGSVTFNTPGTFGYFCAIHPQMTGTVVVTAVDDDDDDNGGATTPTASPTSATGGAGPGAPASGTGTRYDSSESGLPMLMAGGVVVLALGAAGLVLLRRR